MNNNIHRVYNYILFPRSDTILLLALKVSDDMRLTLQDAFGPDGRAVMFQQSNGHLTITRSGHDILNSAFLQNSQTPICNIFLKLISEIQEEIGDGVKYFIFIVNSMLNCLKLDCNVTVIKQFQKVQIVLSNIINELVENESEPCVSKIISSFFSTRFTKIVANCLSKLLFEFITRLSLFTLHDLVKYFSVLCITFNRLPLSESVIKDGFLFKGIILTNRINTNKCLVKVYLYPEEGKPDDNEIESDVSSLILNLNCENCIVLFITNVILPDRAMFLLHFKNIMIAHSVSFEETHFLSEYLMNNSSKDFITEFKLQDNYIWIALSGVSQLILNAPNKDFSSQYKSSIKNCLTLINFTSTKSKMFCTVGGHFEKQFVLNIMNLFSDNSILPPVNCRKELNIWLKMKSEFLLCDQMSKKCDLKRNNSKQIDSVDDVNFNIFLQNICSTISSDISEPIVLKVLCRAMWNVATKFPDKRQDGVEFVIVKLAVLNKAISLVVMLNQTDGLLKVGKKSSLVSSIVKY